ncbi:MAG: hypothetical protein ACJ763_04735 [Bdellovibrionia bacterium]
MMKRLRRAGAALLLAIGLLALPAFSEAQGSPKDATIYISIDLDGTLFDTIRDPRQVETLEDLVKASDGTHKPVWGAAAFVQSLVDIPNAKIVFFSGGDSERNKELLSQLMMKDGKSALDHAYKVFSKADLTPVVTDPNVKTEHQYQRLKKDLKKIDPSIDLSRVIHVDDVPEYVLPEQRANVVAIDPAYDYVENYSRFKEYQRQGLHLENPPPSRRHWAYDTQRLIYARGVIEEALDLTHRREDISLRDAVAQLQKNGDPRRFLDAGNKVLGHYSLEHTRFAREKACPDLIPRLSEFLRTSPSH